MPRLSVDLSWIALRDYPPMELLKDHTHPDGIFHFIYVLKGTGQIRINGTCFTQTPEHIYLTAPGIFHGFSSDRNTPLLSIELKFQITDPVLYAKIVNLPLQIDLRDDAAGQLIRAMQMENDQMQEGYEEILAAQTYELLIRLLRTQSVPKHVPDDLQPVIHYIHSHLRQKITICDLLDIVHLEKSHFSKKFKRHFGVPPMTYIRNVKVEKAKSLIIFSDMSITQISESLGFQTIHHFSKVFHNCTGTYPREYKRSISPK